jgi:hypothetical protein
MDEQIIGLSIRLGEVVDKRGPARSGGGHRRRRRGDHSRNGGQNEVLERVVDHMTTTRAQRAAAIERWADNVGTDDLVEADTSALRVIAELIERRDEVDTALLDAIRMARRADRSWYEIGAMLGVSKQAAQRKYAAKISA